MVGLVISGQYFGWSYGLVYGNALEFFIAVIIIISFYTCLVFSLSRLSLFSPIIKSPNDFVLKHLGSFFGFLVSIAFLIELTFAVPAIAISMGGYMHELFPAVNAHIAALSAVVLVFLLNIMRVNDFAKLELLIVMMALLGLLVFYFFGLQKSSPVHFLSAISHQSLTLHSLILALPFAVWIFLGIEGGTMSAEETANPHKVIPKAFFVALLTVAVCAVLTVFITSSIGSPQVYRKDFPLSEVLGGSFTSSLIAIFGIAALLASLNALLMAASRQVFSLARLGFMPRFFTSLSKNDVPFYSIILSAGFAFLLVALVPVSENFVLLSVFGAVIMYLFVLLAFVKFYFFAKLPAGYLRLTGFVSLLGLFLSVAILYCIVIYSKNVGSFVFFGKHVSVLVVMASLFIFALCCYFLNQRFLSKETN